MIKTLLWKWFNLGSIPKALVGSNLVASVCPGCGRTFATNKMKNVFIETTEEDVRYCGCCCRKMGF